MKRLVLARRETPTRGGQPVAVLDVADPNLLTPGSYIGHHISKAGEYETSAPVAEQNLTPLRSYPDTPSCLAAGDKSDCSFINAPAIDPSTGVIYNTAITRAG